MDLGQLIPAAWPHPLHRRPQLQLTHRGLLSATGPLQVSKRKCCQFFAHPPPHNFPFPAFQEVATAAAHCILPDSALHPAPPRNMSHRSWVQDAMSSDGARNSRVEPNTLLLGVEGHFATPRKACLVERSNLVAPHGYLSRTANRPGTSVPLQIA